MNRPAWMLSPGELAALLLIAALAAFLLGIRA